MYASTIFDGQWHNIRIIKNKGSVGLLYDGKLMSLNPYQPYSGVSTGMNIGRYEAANSNMLKQVNIDEFRFEKGDYEIKDYTPSAAGIALNKTTDTLTVGQSGKLTATVDPSNVDVTWGSSDNSIVRVDSSGKIIGLKEGQAIITATTTDGKTATCTVNVIAQQVTKVKLMLYMNDSTTRKFDLTQDEFNDFMNWYTNMSEEVKGTIPYYIFSIPAQGSIPAQKHCVPFAKIESFEFE